MQGYLVAEQGNADTLGDTAIHTEIKMAKSKKTSLNRAWEKHWDALFPERVGWEDALPAWFKTSANNFVMGIVRQKNTDVTKQDGDPQFAAICRHSIKDSERLSLKLCRL